MGEVIEDGGGFIINLKMKDKEKGARKGGVFFERICISRNKR